MITTVPIKNEKDIAVPDKTVLVLGYFDGIHKGHQKLFEVASKASMKDYLPVVVMTFTESPKLALQPYNLSSCSISSIMRNGSKDEVARSRGSFLT